MLLMPGCQEAILKVMEESALLKMCPKCDIEKPTDMFSKHKGKHDGLQVYCKSCIAIASSLYHESHKKQKAVRQKRWCEANQERVKASKRKWYEANKKEIIDSRRVYQKTNKVAIAASKRQYREANRAKINARLKMKKLTDINYKLASNLRSRLCDAIRSGQKAGSAVRDLGCSIPELKKHLEAKFDSRMTWGNWGIKGWHIDHVTPLASFDLTNRKQFLTANHYTNLQPMWWFDNLSKGSVVN